MRHNIIITTLLSVFIGSCIPDTEDQVFFDEGLLNIAAYLEENKDTYSRFYQIMEEGGMRHALSSYNPTGNGFTLFLPTDEAFGRYIEKNDQYSSFGNLLQDKDQVRELGRYHLVNTSLRSNEFPYGALPDTTATGDLLTIGFSSDLDSTLYKVNNSAPVDIPNLEMVNGYIHIISEVLNPVNYSAFDWLAQTEGFSILTEAFRITGLNDTMGIYTTTPGGLTVRNKYTVLAEHDSIFNKAGIGSIDDLTGKYATPGIPYTDPDNRLYQFTAYHILEGQYFLVDFDQSRNYNTYATAPVRINAGLELMINPGVDTFRLDITETGDTIAVTHLSLYNQESNILTKNGAIHLVSEVMEFYKPPVSTRTFQFFEEPAINDVRNQPGSYFFLEQDMDQMEVISWIGPDEILYYNSASSSEQANRGDYLQIEGNFKISYTIPKILPGRYGIYIRTDSWTSNNENATVIFYLNDQRIGGNFNLNSGGNAGNPYDEKKIGVVELDQYSQHTVVLESLIPGILKWDFIRLRPE